MLQNQRRGLGDLFPMRVGAKVLSHTFELGGSQGLG